MTQEDREGLVTIREYTVPLEAEWAQNVLAAAGICCLLPDRNVNYLYTPVTPVRVQVPAAVAEEAESVLAEMEMHRQAIGEVGASGGAESAEGPAAEEEPSAVEAIDPHDLCPVPESRLACPACGSREVEAAPPPAGVEPTVFESLVAAALGRGWVRCVACGHQWES
jgi:hypothetical protein